MRAEILDRVGADEWTPKAVGEELTEAVRWAIRAGGRVGPAGIKSGMPSLMMDDFDRLAEQWDLTRDLEAKPMRRMYSPAEVSRAERILLWPMTYLSEHPRQARALSFWVLCKARPKVRYSAALDAVGVSRATAYRQRDRGLSLIAQGLTADGIARGRH